MRLQGLGCDEVIKDPYCAFRPEAHRCLSYWWTGVNKFRKRPLAVVDSTSLGSSVPSVQSSRPTEDNDQGLEGYPSLSKRARLNPPSSEEKTRGTLRPFPIEDDTPESGNQKGSKARRLLNEIFQPGGRTENVREAYEDLDSEDRRQFRKLGLPMQPKRTIAKYQSLVRGGLAKMKRKPIVQDEHMPKFLQRQQLKQAMKRAKVGPYAGGRDRARRRSR